ncbi:hypothetical protein [Thalassotalea agariperforans]
MKKPFWLVLLTLIVYINPSVANESITSSKVMVLSAIKDFPVTNAGHAPYYVDKRTKALGINAGNEDYRNVFARAVTTFEGGSGEYNVTIRLITEEDGEPLYRLLINNEVVRTYRASYIGKGSAKDLTAEDHTWQQITLKKGDEIAIESATHTNGEVPENGGTAWARGRWQQLTFTLKTR